MPMLICAGQDLLIESLTRCNPKGLDPRSPQEVEKVVNLVCDLLGLPG